MFPIHTNYWNIIVGMIQEQLTCFTNQSLRNNWLVVYQSQQVQENIHVFIWLKPSLAFALGCWWRVTFSESEHTLATYSTVAALIPLDAGTLVSYKSLLLQAVQIKPSSFLLK